MDQVLREAEDALARGDWPVGSILVRDGVVLATGQNRQTPSVTWPGTRSSRPCDARARCGEPGWSHGVLHHGAVSTGVRERECTALRRRWGKDSVRAS